MTTPLNYNLNNIPLWRDSASSLIFSIVLGDSWMKGQTNRLQGSIDALELNHVAGACHLVNDANYGVEYKLTPEGGGNNWVDDGILSLGSAWGSDGNTSIHSGQSRTLRLASPGVSGFDFIFAVMLDKEKRGIPDGVDITIAFRYRKEGLQGPVDFRTRSYTESTGGSESVGGLDLSEGSFTLESGAGLGWATTTIPASDNTSSVAKIGVQVRTGGAAQGFTNVAQIGDRLEILDFVWFISETSGGTKVLKPSLSSGFALFPITDDGRSAQEFADDLSSSVLTSLLSKLAEIRGGGGKTSTSPVQVVDEFLGVNKEAGDSNSSIPDFIAGKSALVSLLDSRFTALGLAVPDYCFRAMPTTIQSATSQQPRMLLQETALYNFCRINGYGFISWYGAMGGVLPDLLTGDDPWGTAWGTIVMDAGDLHLNDQASNARAWQLDLAHTDPANIFVPDNAGDPGSQSLPFRQIGGFRSFTISASASSGVNPPLGDF